MALTLPLRAHIVPNSTSVSQPTFTRIYANFTFCRSILRARLALSSTAQWAGRTPHVWAKWGYSFCLPQHARSRPECRTVRKKTALSSTLSEGGV